MALASPSEPSQLQPVQVKDSVISAKHLAKKFGDETAVQDVSFDVPRSSIFGFIGPSGSGKTTTSPLIDGRLHTHGWPSDCVRSQSGPVQPG